MGSATVSARGASIGERRGRVPAAARRAALAVLLLLPVPFASASGQSFDPDSVITVEPQDGRPAQPVPIVRHDAASYLPLASLARAFGVPWSWDPYSYRGWIETDSVRTRFTFDSPLLIHGSEVIQLSEAVRYDGNGVLMPLDYLNVLKTHLTGDRVISWRPRERRFVWSAAMPRYRQVRLTEVGHRSSLRISGDRPKSGLLFWSPVAGLDILLEGLVPHPESLTVSLPRGLFAVDAVSGLAFFSF